MSEGHTGWTWQTGPCGLNPSELRPTCTPAAWVGAREDCRVHWAGTQLQVRGGRSLGRGSHLPPSILCLTSVCS